MRLLLAAALLLLSSRTEAMKGINDIDQARYQDSRFLCDHDYSISREMVNDDFCDCLDGTDEPGTSACKNGQFFCRNTGHKSLKISSSKIADGVCDCCDGSDEKNCADICGDLAQEDAKIQASQNLQREKGLIARSIWVEEAAKVLNSAREELVKMRADLAAILPELAEAKAVLDSETVLETAEKARLNAERDARIEARRVANLESVPAFRVHMDAHVVASPLPDFDGTDIIKLVPPAAKEQENFPYPPEYAAPKDQAPLFPYPAEYAAPAAANNAVEDTAPPAFAATEGPSETKPVEAIMEDPDPPVDYKSESLAAAKKKHDAINRRKDTTERTIKDKEAELAYDFGPDQVFAKMLGKCFSGVVQQYTYEVCPFGSASQKEKSSSTNLGKFNRWLPDTQVPTMEFTGGAKCWQGPARSVTVQIECAEDVQVLSVEEPSKCVYAMRMTAPAACRPS
jgi:protein kinase C substrate 80K-H